MRSLAGLQKLTDRIIQEPKKEILDRFLVLLQELPGSQSTWRYYLRSAKGLGEKHPELALVIIRSLYARDPYYPATLNLAISIFQAHGDQEKVDTLNIGLQSLMATGNYENGDAIANCLNAPLSASASPKQYHEVMGVGETPSPSQESSNLGLFKIDRSQSDEEGFDEMVQTQLITNGPDSGGGLDSPSPESADNPAAEPIADFSAAMFADSLGLKQEPARESTDDPVNLAPDPNSSFSIRFGLSQGVEGVDLAGSADQQSESELPSPSEDNLLKVSFLPEEAFSESSGNGQVDTEPSATEYPVEGLPSFLEQDSLLGEPSEFNLSDLSFNVQEEAKPVDNPSDGLLEDPVPANHLLSGGSDMTQPTEVPEDSYPASLSGNESFYQGINIDEDNFGELPQKEFSQDDFYRGEFSESKLEPAPVQSDMQVDMDLSTSLSRKSSINSDVLSRWNNLSRLKSLLSEKSPDQMFEFISSRFAKSGSADFARLAIELRLDSKDIYFWSAMTDELSKKYPAIVVLRFLRGAMLWSTEYHSEDTNEWQRAVADKCDEVLSNLQLPLAPVDMDNFLSAQIAHLESLILRLATASIGLLDLQKANSS